ncbi:uncharacterized protein LOC144202671 [Stigmatopora nigra]
MPGGKRRFGSHRRVGQHVEMPEDLFVTDQPPVLQPYEDKGSFNLLPNEGQVTLESQNLISSKQQSSRRKLASNRASKRRGVEQVSVESYHKPTEDIEDASAEKIQTQMIQTAGSSSEDYDSLYGTHLYSAYTPGDTSEALIPSHPDEKELHQPINSVLHSAQDGGEMDSKWDSGSCEKLENPEKLWPDKLDFQTMSVCVLNDIEKETVDKDPTQPNTFLGEIRNFDSMETTFPAKKKDGPASTNDYNEIAQIKNNVEEQNRPSAIDNLSANEHEPSDGGSQFPHQIQIKELKTDPTKSQELDNDIEEMFEQSAKEVSSKMMESKFTSQSVQPEHDLVFESQSNDNNVSADEQTDSVSQAEKTGAFDNGSKNIKEETFEMETTELEHLEIRGLYNTFQEESISDFVRGNEHAVSPPSKKMPEDKESIFESEQMTRDANGNCDESPAGQSLENAEVPNATPEVCTSNEYVKISHHATISPPNADMSRDEELTDLHTKQDTAVQQPDEVLVKGASLLDPNQTKDCEILIDKLQGDVDQNTGIVSNILETHASKLNLGNSFDLGLLPLDNAKVVPMKDYASNSMSKWVETGRKETTESQVNENEMKDELMTSESSQSVEPEKEIFDSQTDDHNASADEQTDSLTDVRIRRKLGSSRHDQRRHIKVFADELYNDSGFIASNTHSQILHEQLSETEVSGSEEAPVVQSKTTLVVENVQADFPEHPVSDAKLSIATLEMCTSKGGLKKDTEYSEAKATISSTKAEIPTNVQHEHSSSFKDIDAPYPNFILNKELQSTETERKEDIFNPALNLNLNIITKKTHNEPTNDAADEKDPPEDEMTFGGEQPNIQDVNTESDTNVKSPMLKDKRRIGSKRKNLGTLAKGDLELKLNLSKGGALVHDVLTEHACQSDDKELKHESSEPNKEHTGDPPSAVLAHDTGEENIISEYQIQGDTLETKSIAAKPDGISELELRVRKRKMGSHRKSRLQQTHVKPDNVGKLQTEPVTASTTHHLADETIQGADEFQT